MLAIHNEDLVSSIYIKMFSVFGRNRYSKNRITKRNLNDCG